MEQWCECDSLMSLDASFDLSSQFFEVPKSRYILEVRIFDWVVSILFGPASRIAVEASWCMRYLGGHP